MRQTFEYLKAFLLLLAVAVVSGIIVMKVSIYSGGETVAAPDLRGKQVVPAMEAVQAKGLYLEVTRMEHSHSVPKDRIISQDPAPGEPIKTGREVAVVISRGSPDALTPDVIGSSLLRAGAVLDNNDLKIKKTIYIHSARAKDTIIAQNPPANSQVRKGDSMTLLISSGPYPEHIMTPDFVDQRLADVMKKIREMDLRIRRVSYETSPDKERGVVIRQEPAFGARVEKGSFVSLTVSEGEAPEGGKPATYTIFYYTVPDGPAAVKVTITQENRDGEKEVYNRVHRPGDTLSLLVEVKGKTAAKVFLDNELAEVKRF